MKFSEKESSTLELKAELPKNNQIIKTIIGFCNQNGGRLIIGIDKNRNVIGISEETAEKMREYLDKSIHESTAPSIIPSVYTQLIGDKLVLIIEVSSGMNKPYYLRSEGLDKGVYIRLGRSTIHANADMIEELRWQSRGKDFEKMAAYNGSEQDLDKKAIATFLEYKQTKQKSKITIEQALLVYNLVITEHAHRYPTNAGILLFGKDPQHFFPYAIIMCTHFKGVSGREVISNKDCTGQLIDQYNAAHEFLLTTLNKSFKIEGKYRKEKLEIPEVAIREVLVNAIVHRNYHTSSPIKIAIYENRVEIYSPGNFAGPITQYGLLSGSTFWRNTAICRVFRELGLIELMGSGLIELFRSYKDAGLDTPEVIEGEGYIKCILPRPTVNRRITKVQRDLSEEYQDILSLFRQATDLSISDIINSLDLARTTAARKINQMIKKGLLFKTGRGKGTRYFVK